MWTREQIIADLEDWIVGWRECAEIANGINTCESKERAEVYEEVADGIEWTLKKANGEISGFEDQWKEESA